MRIKTLEPIKLNGAWQNEKTVIADHINNLQEATKADLTRLEKKVSNMAGGNTTPSLENIVGRTLAAGAGWYIHPVLGVGIALMSADSFISAIRNSDECFEKSRFVRALKVLTGADTESGGRRLDINNMSASDLQQLKKELEKHDMAPVPA